MCTGSPGSAVVLRVVHGRWARQLYKARNLGARTGSRDISTWGMLMSRSSRTGIKVSGLVHRLLRFAGARGPAPADRRHTHRRNPPPQPPRPPPSAAASNCSLRANARSSSSSPAASRTRRSRRNSCDRGIDGQSSRSGGLRNCVIVLTARNPLTVPDWLDSQSAQIQSGTGYTAVRRFPHRHPISQVLPTPSGGGSS